MVNDRISDLLTRIRNASTVKHRCVEVPLTKIVNSIVYILKQEGYIQNFEILYKGTKYSIIIFLKYIDEDKKSVLTELTRISKPGARVYISSNKIPNILGNMGIGIISTSRGVMTTNKAKKLKIGGEFLCKIY